jgi:hypothetical protein
MKTLYRNDGRPEEQAKAYSTADGQVGAGVEDEQVAVGFGGICQRSDTEFADA